MKKLYYHTHIRVLAILLTIVMVIVMLSTFALATNGQDVNPFTDVADNDWYYNYVTQAYQAGLFKGTSATTFSPNAPMTRAMLVTVLYRIEMLPSVQEVKTPFIDIQTNAWYADAVKWAYYEGIVFGTSVGVFSPNENISREQLATILYRYAKYLGYTGTNAIDSFAVLFSAFVDANKTSNYARESLAWCYLTQIMRGTSKAKLNPRENSTRAETTTMLCRFLDYKDLYTKHIHIYTACKNIAATCVQDGYMVYACTCGVTSQRHYVPAVGHSFGAWLMTTTATQYRNGIMQRTCGKCGYTESYEFPYFNMKSDHAVYIPDAGINASYTSCALTQECVDAYDIVCDFDIIAYGDITAIIAGHNYRSLGKLYLTRIGSKIYMSHNGHVYAFTVLYSEEADWTADNTDVIGWKTGISVLAPDAYHRSTVRLYTCYHGHAWLVYATLDTVF